MSTWGSNPANILPRATAPPLRHSWLAYHKGAGCGRQGVGLKSSTATHFCLLTPHTPLTQRFAHPALSFLTVTNRVGPQHFPWHFPILYDPFSFRTGNVLWCTSYVNHEHVNWHVHKNIGVLRATNHLSLYCFKIRNTKNLLVIFWLFLSVKLDRTDTELPYSLISVVKNYK